MYRYLLLCILMLLLSACTDSDRFAEAAFQYRIDSAVNARLDSVQNSLQRRNDSLLLEAARSRVDSQKQSSTSPAPRPAPAAQP